ncbi:MAG: YIP1 family protein [Clostridia bacterium]|nr:YIP1 family protein [Clostridia bacterium]
MKKALCRLFAVILAVATVFGALTTVSAALPTDSYTYWTNVGNARKAVYSKPMYDVDKMIDVADFGIKRLETITAMCRDDNDNLYILDAASRIVVLDDNYNFVREIGLINGTIDYKNAKGIYYSGGYIYVCNTDGANIYMIDVEGNLFDTITLPESNLIPDDFIFKPTKVTRDANGYMYVVSEGCYYGALLYSPEREFLGFYGANAVNATVASVFTNISNRLFPNAEKHANSIRKLPYPFVDITIDKEGFVYTSNAFTDTSSANRKGQIRKLSPGYGTNILNSKVNFTDEKLPWGVISKQLYKHDICDIEVDDNGFIYALESCNDKVYLYDPDCKLLTVFGGGLGNGGTKGSFANSCAMVIKDSGNEVLIADSRTGFVTIFKINEYGKLVKKADLLTYEGHYKEAKTDWELVLNYDANSQVAYSGIANAYLEEEDYDTALSYAKRGYDKDTYAVAFEYVRSDFISDNFTWIFIVLVVVVLGAIALMFITNKKKIVFIKNQSLNLMLTTIVHPSDNFTDIKEKGLGSIPLCLVLIVLYYVVTVMKTIAGGFLFSNYDPTSFNSIIELIRSVGLVVLWIVSNWLVCTLLGGKGKMKEIMIITCYSLQPLIIEGVISIILSNVLLPTEASFLSILSVIGMIYAGFMLVMGMLKIHDFSVGKFILTTILTIIGIAIIVFLIIMLIILIQQFGAFVLTLWTELTTI